MSLESRVKYLEENQTEVARINYIEISLDECKQLPFWCNRLVGDDKCCISHLAGMPEHPNTLQQMNFTPYQLEFIDIIDKSDNNKFHVNKPRQSGFSEIVLRIFQDRGFKKYSTKSCKYVVGTREKTTKKMIRRLKQLYKRIPDVVENNSSIAIAAIFVSPVIASGFAGNPSKLVPSFNSKYNESLLFSTTSGIFLYSCFNLRIIFFVVFSLVPTTYLHDFVEYFLNPLSWNMRKTISEKPDCLGLFT